MRIPVTWLREYCDPGLSAEEIADTLTMAGIKEERIHRVGVGDPAEFVVGKVLTTLLAMPWLPPAVGVPTVEAYEPCTNVVSVFCPATRSQPKMY